VNSRALIPGLCSRRIFLDDIRPEDYRVLYELSLDPEVRWRWEGERRKAWEGTRPGDIDGPWALAFRWLRRPDHTKPPTLCDAPGLTLDRESDLLAGWSSRPTADERA